MTSFTNALQKAVDNFTGVSRVDNSTDPTSALSMLRRKAATKPITKQPLPGKSSTGIGVGM